MSVRVQVSTFGSEMLVFCVDGPRAMLVILALWLAEFGVAVTSSNVAWQENVRPKMYVQLGKFFETSEAPFDWRSLVWFFLQPCRLVRNVWLVILPSLSRRSDSSRQRSNCLSWQCNNCKLFLPYCEADWTDIMEQRINAVEFFSSSRNDF